MLWRTTIANTTLAFGYRCFLFLVNYSRMKPDIALKALPILVNVRARAFLKHTTKFGLTSVL